MTKPLIYKWYLVRGMYWSVRGFQKMLNEVESKWRPYVIPFEIMGLGNGFHSWTVYSSCGYPTTLKSLYIPYSVLFYIGVISSIAVLKSFHSSPRTGVLDVGPTLCPSKRWCFILLIAGRAIRGFSLDCLSSGMVSASVCTHDWYPRFWSIYFVQHFLIRRS